MGGKALAKCVAEVCEKKVCQWHIEAINKEGWLSGWKVNLTNAEARAHHIPVREGVGGRGSRAHLTDFDAGLTIHG